MRNGIKPAVWIGLGLMATAVLATYIATPYFTVRGKYQIEFNRKFDAVNDLLAQMADGKNTVQHDSTVIFSGNDGTLKANRNARMTYSIARDLYDSIQQLQHHFEAVPLPFIYQDPDGFEDWGKKLKADYLDQYAHAQKYIGIIRKNPRNIPDYENISVYGSEHTDVTMNRVEKMLVIDIDAWIPLMRNEIQTRRGKQQK